MKLKDLLARAEARATAARQVLEAINARIDGFNADDDTLTDDTLTTAARERAEARSALDGAVLEVTTLQAEVEAEERENAALATRTGSNDWQRDSGPARIVSEPETYRKGGQDSYFRDLMRVSLNRGDFRSAAARLERNDRQVAEALQARALTTVDGAGGEFVPPLWMMDQMVELARPGRVIIDQLDSQALPAGTDTISLPRLATGTATAEQATQNTSVQNTDATTSSVSAAVATIAGQQVVSVQLLEQSPMNVDQVLMKDLAADYAIKADIFAINNNAANKVGLLNVSGINAVTLTPITFAGLYAAIAQGIAAINTNRYMPGDKIFMHPRRWGAMLGAMDTNGRPLFNPVANAFNPAANQNGVTAQGYAGDIQGLPVFLDPNIPTNLGAGTNEDRIIIVRSSDSTWYESTLRSEAFRETKADQLSVLLRVYNYVALHASRLPKSISVLAGVGLAGTVVAY